MNKKCNCNRRSFLIKSTKIAILSGTAVYGLQGCSTEKDNNPVATGPYDFPISVDITHTDNVTLQNTGGAVYVEDPNNEDRPIIVYRAGDTEVNAFSSRCTHRSGPVGLLENGKFTCSWHGAEFDTEGQAIALPATTALKSYTATINGNIITITNE